MVIEHDNDYRFKPWQWMKQGLLRLCLCRRLYSSLCLCFRLCLLLFLLLFLSLFLCTSFASPVAIAQSQRLVVDAHTAHYNAGQALQMIEDASQRLEFANVLNPTAALPWQTAIQNHSDDVGLGYTRSAWWFKLPLKIDPKAPNQWLLEVAYSTIDRIELYVPKADGSYTNFIGGDLLPFSARYYPHRFFVFPIQLEPNTEPVIYIRVKSDGNITLPVHLWQSEAFSKHNQITYGQLSIYYGMLLALSLYNLLLFFSTREYSFLAHVGYTVSMALGQSAWNGLSNQFLWSEYPAFGNIAVLTCLALTGVFSCIFTRTFLQTRLYSPTIDRMLLATIGIFAIASIGPLIMPYFYVAALMSAMGIISSIVAITAGYYCMRSGHLGARYFLIAWSLFILGVVVFCMRNFNILPTNWLTLNTMQIGSALELLLLSFALADRINIMRQEKDQATEAALTANARVVEALRSNEQELEQRVTERTLRLEEANQELRNKERELEHLVRHDPLTGLANRLYLNEHMTRAILRARCTGFSVVLLVIDLDGFKQVNDTFGHPAGDELLVHVAKRIRNNLRESDLVARVGGDEFIIMLEHTRFPDGMTKLAQKLLTIINEPILLQAGTTQVSGSIGIASYPEHADSASLLLKHADAAMYQAKLLGRNQYAMAADMTPPLTPQDQQNQQGHQAQPVQPAQQTQQPEQSQQPTPSQQQPSV